MLRHCACENDSKSSKSIALYRLFVLQMNFKGTVCPHKSLRIFNLLKTNVDNCRPGRKCLVYFLCIKIETKGSQLYLNEATAIKRNQRIRI